MSATNDNSSSYLGISCIGSTCVHTHRPVSFSSDNASDGFGESLVFLCSKASKKLMRATKFAFKLFKQIFTQNAQRSYKRSQVRTYKMRSVRAQTVNLAFSRCAARTHEMCRAHIHDTPRAVRAREMRNSCVQDTWLPCTRYAAYTHKTEINILQICARSALLAQIAHRAR